ncbi:hypothetical protein ACP4OV_017474 [Aristida adscensionis]
MKASLAPNTLKPYRLSLPLTRNFNLSATNLIGHSKELVCSWIPTSRVDSQNHSTSPLSFEPSLPNPTRREDWLNENLNEEVARLHSQVKELTHNALTTQISKLWHQEQLKGVLQTTVGLVEYLSCFGVSIMKHHLLDLYRSPDSSDHQTHQLSCNGNNILTDAEWIEQVEHGVYITVFRTPAGQKYLRRVRFRSRKVSPNNKQSDGGLNTDQQCNNGMVYRLGIVSSGQEQAMKRVRHHLERQTST